MRRCLRGRLLATALEICGTLPEGFERDVRAVPGEAGSGEGRLDSLARLLDSLDSWLRLEGFELDYRPVPVTALF